MSSRMRALGLLRRQRAHGRGASYLVSLLVLAVAGLVVATPSAFTAMAAKELSQTVTKTTPTGRYLVATSPSAPATGSSVSPARSPLDPALDREYGAFTDQLVEIHDALPQPLRGMVGPARWSITTPAFDLGARSQATKPPGANVAIVMRVDPYAGEHAELVEGSWPALDDEDDEPIGVVLSEDSVDHLAWKVGTVRAGYRLTGVFRAKDPQDDYWALNDGMLETFVFDDGNQLPRITVTGFVDPLRWRQLFLGPLVIGVKTWFPLDLAEVAGDDVDTVIGQLRGVTAKTFQVPGDVGSQSVAFSASGIPALEAARGRTQAARSVLTLAAMGPIGAALVVLALGISAFGARRRHAVGLLATRGASHRQVRGVLALEGLLIGVPAAFGAVLCAWLVFGADLSPTGVVLALLIGLTPAAVLACVSIDAAVRPVRADTGMRSHSRYRWAVEVGLVGLAAVSVYLLYSAGLPSADDAGGVDVLVAAAPVLLAAAACVVVLRLYPLPLQLVSRLLRKGRSAIGFLGSVRALRDPVVGAAPVLAVLAGVAVAVFSAVILSTITQGTRDAALAGVGADLRLDGPFVTEEMAAAVRDVAGVTAAARVGRVDSKIVGSPGHAPGPAVIYLADLDDLAVVQADVIGRAPVPADPPADAVVVSPDLASDEGAVSYAGGSATVVGSASRASGVVQGDDRWVIADAGNEAFGSFNPTTLLMALDDDADATAVRRDIEAIVGEAGVFTDTSAIEADLRDDAVTSGLRTALVAAIVAAGAAGAATVVLTLVLGARARSRLLAILRVLGFTQRQRSWLVAWEQAPTAIGALVVGVVLGLGLAVMVHDVVDLSPFTGEEDQPALVVDWLGLVALVGGFVVLMTVAIGFGLLATRRTSAAMAVRLGDD